MQEKLTLADIFKKRDLLTCCWSIQRSPGKAMEVFRQCDGKAQRKLSHRQDKYQNHTQSWSVTPVATPALPRGLTCPSASAVSTCLAHRGWTLLLLPLGAKASWHQRKLAEGWLTCQDLGKVSIKSFHFQNRRQMLQDWLKLQKLMKHREEKTQVLFLARFWIGPRMEGLRDWLGDEEWAREGKRMMPSFWLQSWGDNGGTY